MTDLAGKKTAWFSFAGIIDSQGVTRVATAFNMSVNSHCDEVYLCMNSLGGYVGDGIYLHNHIRGLPIKTTIHNTGNISSIAVAVFVAANLRYCSAHSLFLVHPTSLGPFGEALTAGRLDSALKSALAEEGRTENILRERTSLPPRTLKARRIGDVHIRPDEALKFGLVHEVREFSLPKGQEILQI